MSPAAMDKHPTEPVRLPHEGDILPASDQRITEVTKQIEAYYRQIPLVLRSLPDAQARCLRSLLEAEQALTPPITRPQLIHGRLLLTRVQIELARATMTQTAFTSVAAVVYGLAGLFAVLFQFGVVGTATTAQELSTRLVLGVPQPVLFWAIIGTLTSMLVRAGHVPFADRAETLRWMLFRPVVGVVMGVMMYLLVIAGLIVFAGRGQAQTPELLWIVAFAGGFSDALSINLLQRLLGRFRLVDAPAHRRPAEDDPDAVGMARPRLGPRDGTPRTT